MSSREDRIMNLAATLKASGLAKSEVQARMMAEEMIGVEENVQKKYEEEHVKAHEYLKTAKNLGDNRVKAQPQQESRPKIEPIGTRIQPIPAQTTAQPRVDISKVDTSSSKNNLLKPVDESVHEKKIELEEVHTDMNFGKGTLKDLMLNQIKTENHEIKTIEQLEEEAVENKDDSQEAPAETKENIDVLPEEKVEEVVDENAKEESVPESPKEDVAEDVKEDSAEQPALDGTKLREMMEEDGPMEEHTREITEKPKDVKPKEDYVENTVDLSNMFNFNKK